MTEKVHRQDQFRQWLDDATEAWIGYAMPPADQAIEEAQWMPDARNDYCSRCGDSVGAGEATVSGCGACREKPGVADGVVRLGSYDDDLRQWVLDIKYQRWAEMGILLGCQLGQSIMKAGVVDPHQTVIVPMPMPWQRRIYRGIDHAQVIAHGVSKELHAPVVSVLRRANGPPQTSLPMSQRKKAISQTMRLKRVLGGWRLHDLHIVLVDDVRTTGASIRTANRLMHTLNPARIVACVLSVSDEVSRRSRRELNTDSTE